MNPVPALKSLLLMVLALSGTGSVVAQADVSVRVRLERDVAQSGETLTGTAYLTNEGDARRQNLLVELRPTVALDFERLDTNPANTFSAGNYRWSVASLDSGATDSLRFTLRATAGGVHTLVAELIGADVTDWDSQPDNQRPEEDDQTSSCLSVPLEVGCGQAVVLRAPLGFASYSWTRDGQPLTYATSDTLHPSRSGAYAYRVEGGACGDAGGTCCPVRIERTGCTTDLALRITAGAVDAGTLRQLVRINLFNQGTTTVSRADLYVTLSNRMRLAQALPRWTYRDTYMTTEWRGSLAPGTETELTFEVQAIGRGAAADYRMFAEISAAYAGDALLSDVDSRADEDPGNDLVLDDAIALLSTQDEDDSDVVDLQLSQATVHGCELAVFAEADYRFVRQGSNGTAHRVCLLTTQSESDALTFELDGEAVQLSPAACAEGERAKFSLARLSGDLEGSRYLITSYRAGGSTRVSRKVVSSLAALLDALRGVDPAARVSYDTVAKEIQITSATLRPDRLSVFHYDSRKSASLTPRFEATATGVYLPGNTAGGLHTLEAFDAAGCRTSTRIEIKDNTVNPVRYDTIRADVEVGEPYVVRTANGERTVDARWTQLSADAWTASFGTIGTRVTSSFAEDRRVAGEVPTEITYQLTVVERACTPLMSNTPRTKVSATCSGAKFALGLLRPDLEVRSAGSRVLSTATPTGVRDASSYDLQQLPQRGLTHVYEVAHWAGVPAATGLRGHIGQLATQLRQLGEDVDILWSNSRLVAGGAGVGGLELREVGTGAVRTLSPTSQSQPTYGEIYANVGNNYVNLSLRGGCEQLLTLKLKCQDEFFFDAGSYDMFSGGDPTTLSLSELGIPSTHANWTIANPPGKVQVRRLADGAGLELSARSIGEDELTLRACDDGGDCFLSRVSLHVSGERAAAKPVARTYRESIAVRVGETLEWCLPAPDTSKRTLRVVNQCEYAAGERATILWRGDTCLTAEGIEAGRESLCILRTYTDGSTDSIALSLLVELADKVLVLTPDEQAVEFGKYSMVEVLANDQLGAGDHQVSLVSEPFFGRAQVVGNQQIEYTHYGNDCSADVFTYQVCRGSVCDSATVELTVFCGEVLVYNGLSPNGDGVNDEFVIHGLERFPDHELRIFDPQGRLIFRQREYGNDWRGEYRGRPLRNGTYYYVLELGDGGGKSGYIQLTE